MRMWAVEILDQDVVAVGATHGRREGTERRGRIWLEVN